MDGCWPILQFEKVCTSTHETDDRVSIPDRINFSSLRHQILNGSAVYEATNEMSPVASLHMLKRPKPETVHSTSPNLSMSTVLVDLSFSGRWL